MVEKNKGASLSRNESAFYAQVREVIVEARRYVHKTANVAMVKAYWLVGKMIVEKQGGAAKAAYGDGLIDALAERLTAEFGAGFTRVNLFAMRKFYLSFSKVQTLCEQLSWSHYRLLITVENEEARQYYAEECRKSLWSVRELQRQIGKGSDLVRYTLPLNEKRIFAAKYKLVLPTEEQLLAEIRREQVALEEATLIGQVKRSRRDCCK